MVVLASPNQAAFLPYRMPCSYLARGASGIALSEDERMTLLNPAILSDERITPFVYFFYKNYFNIPALSDISLAWMQRLFHIPALFQIIRFGNNKYQEMQFNFSSSVSLTKSLLLGGSLEAYYLHVEHYGNYQAFGSRLGLLFDFLPGLKFAAVAGNLHQPRLGKQKDEIPVYLDTGLSFDTGEKVILSIDLFKENDFPFEWRYGLTCNPLESFYFHLGFQQYLHSFAVGISIKQGCFLLEYTFDYHPQLSVSHALGVGYAL